ncbi:MAG: molybdenum cofactor synthesis domain-containing protein [Bacteroidales bacterium]
MSNTQPTVVSVNKASSRGTKKPANTIKLSPGGVQGDVHQHSGHREVSLLDEKHINDFINISQAAKHPGYGAFAENITTKDLPESLQVYDFLEIGNVLLMVTQIGKPFHEELEFPGHYVSPQKAVFCKVIRGGTIQPGATINHKPKVFKTLIITLSTRAYQEIYDDKSGPLVEKYITEFFKQENLKAELTKKILPDNTRELSTLLKSSQEYDFILTTGGTGIAKTDITIETVRPMLSKEIPGIPEMIRWRYGLENPNALLSRSLLGTIGQTVIFCMPGSPKAIHEYMEEFLKTTNHIIQMVNELKH